MPLPPNGTPWPPKELAKITNNLREWDAWYSGDPIKLSEQYGYISPGIPGYPVARAAQYRAGIIGGIARWFWGQPTQGQQLTKLHVPIAADICQAGADLLFAEPPTFTVDNPATQTRLDELGDDTLHSVLAEASEIGGALGGSYLRVSWDRDIVADKPFLTCVHADAAVPEFRYGRLVAVTFWTRVLSDGRTVWRHLERHELDSQRNGVIQHGLYVGSENDLGRAVPLTEQAATAGLAKLVNADSMISTESPGLACVYVPNQRPQRRWRNDPIGCHLGRSALDGIEHFMDALDETYSSWMRDIRLGKGRVFVARSLLESNGAGQGGAWDADQEVFSPLNLLENRAGAGGQLPIQAEQFAIRFAEHEATANNFVAVILRTAGFSQQTFGMDGEGSKASNKTATEVQAHERRSYLTRDRMIRLTKPQVAAITTKLLWVDKTVFGNSAIDPTKPVDVQFADSVQDSQITLAQTVQALDVARAASTKTKVEMLHPDWDKKAVDDEVKLILAETASAVPDPTAFGADPADPANGPQPA